MRHYGRWLFAILWMGLLCIPALPSHAGGESESVIKAVMIRKFIEFIQWPEEVSPQKTMEVRVCVYGDSPMARTGIVFEKRPAGAPMRYVLTVRTTLEGIAGACHVLFIAESKQDQMGAVLQTLRSQPVLTVGDMSGFVEKGGMIGFQIIEGKVRYNMNNRAFGAARIQVDAQLLEIANKVVE